MIINTIYTNIKQVLEKFKKVSQILNSKLVFISVTYYTIYEPLVGSPQ